MINHRYVKKASKPLYAVKLNKGVKPYQLTTKKLKVTLIKSIFGIVEDQRATVLALGLHKIRQEKIHNDNKAIQGMLFKVKHLVKVEEVK